MIAKVTIDIPHHAVDKSFDYKVPKTLSHVQIGMRIIVDFNHKKHQGIITGFKKTSTHKNLKSIESIIDEKPLISEAALAFAETLRTDYAMPLFDYLHLMIPAPLKKPLKRPSRLQPFNPNQPKPLTLSADQTHQLHAITQSIKEGFKIVVDQDDQTLQTLIGFLKDQRHQRILILQPDILSAERLYDDLKAYLPACTLYHSKLKISEKRKALKALDDHQAILIGSKVALFIAPEQWDLIIIGHADSKFYQHLERPRFDTLKISERIHQNFHTPLIYMSHTPPLKVLKGLEEGTMKDHRHHHALALAPLNVIALNSHALTAPSLLHPHTQKSIDETLNHQHKVLIIHEKKDDDSYHDGRRNQGIESFMEEAKMAKAYAITGDTINPLEILDAFEKDGQILGGTSLLLHLRKIKDVKKIIFLRWDDFLKDATHGDLQGYNALVKASHLLDAEGEIIVQTYQENHRALKAYAKPSDDFLTQEYEKTRQLDLPPFIDMVQIILKSNTQSALTFYSQSALKYVKKALRNHAHVLGPHFKDKQSIITIKSGDLTPYRSSLRSLIQAFHDDIHIELRPHQFII